MHPLRLSLLCIVATVLLIAAPVLLFAQKDPGILWQKPLGGLKFEYATGLTQTTDSGYIVLGQTDSDDLPRYHPFSNTPQRRYYDYYVARVTKHGVLEWQNAYGGDSTDSPYSVVETTDGGCLIAGNTTSKNGDVSGSKGSTDAWLLKLNNAGTIEWQKTFGGTNNDGFQSISRTSDGGYILAGFTTSQDGDVTSVQGLMDVWIVKITASGTLQWQKTYGGSASDAALRAIPTRDGNYIFCGGTASTNGDVSGQHGSNDIWVVKINPTGNILWQKTLGGTNQETCYTIIETLDGGFAVLGTSRSADGDVLVNRGATDQWLVKLTSGGAMEWQKTYGGSLPEGDYPPPLSLIQRPDSSFVIGTTTASSDGDLSGLSLYGPTDIWIFQTDKFGKITWAQLYGGTSWEMGASIIGLPDGYTFFGIAQSLDRDVKGIHKDSLSAGALYDTWLVRLCTWTGYKLTGDTIDFGNVPICTYRDTIIELTNTGCYTHYIDSVGFTGAGFEMLRRPRTLFMHKVDTFRVRFHSEKHGKSTASITVQYREDRQAKSFTLPIRATGSAGSVELSSSMDSFNYVFPPLSVCSKTDTQSVTLKNLGCDTIKIVNIAFANDGTTLVGSRVGPAKSRIFDKDTLLLRWLVTPSAEGSFQAQIVLTLKYPDGSTRDTILTSNVTILPGSAQLANTLNTTQYTFKVRPACTSKDSARFAIRNLGCDTLQVTNVVFTNDGTTLTSSGPTSGKLIGNQELTYRWLLDPQQPGSYQASVTITYKLPDGTLKDTTFSATAAVSAGAPLFSSSLQSSSYVFSPRSLCAGNDTAQIVIRNGGCDTLEIVNVQFTNTSEITGTVEALDATLTGPDSAVLSWIFDPSVQGNYTANITITYRLPDGTERDTTITATGTVLPGDAQFISSLPDPAFTFASLPACGDSDTIEFAIKNPGCDTLSIVNVSFTNHAGILEGSQDATLTSLIADDSIVFRWLATATSPGTYQASITVTYKLPDGSQHDTTFSASFTVTPGSKSMTQSLTGIDYGSTFICQVDDSTIVITNSGCDTMTVFSAVIANPAFSFTASPSLPRQLQPDESISFRVSLGTPDTTGHPLAVSDMLIIQSTADLGTVQIPLTRQIIYPVQCGLQLSAPVTAENLKKASYTLTLTGTPPPTATAMYFDLIYDGDLLEFFSIDQMPGSSLSSTGTTRQGSVTTTSFVVSPIPTASDFSAVTFLAYLAKADTTLVTTANIRFDVESNMPIDCIASVTNDASIFRYDELCGEPTIRSYMQGKPIFNIVALRPQPAASTEKVVYMDIDMHEAGEIALSYRDVLGASQSLRTLGLQKGRHTVPVDIAALGEGVHFIAVECGGRTEIRKLIVQ